MPQSSIYILQLGKIFSLLEVPHNHPCIDEVKFGMEKLT